MRIKSKLLVLIFIPLFALTMAAAFGFRDQSSAIETAERSSSAIGATNAVHDSVVAVGAERLVAAGADVGDLGFSDVVELRTATDATLVILSQQQGLGELSAELTDRIATARATGGLESVANYTSVNAALLAQETVTPADFPSASTNNNHVITRLALDSLEMREQAWLAYISADEASVDTAVDLSGQFANATMARVSAVDFADNGDIDRYLQTPANRNLTNLESIAVDDIREQELSVNDAEALAAVADFRSGWAELIDNRNVALDSEVDQTLVDANGLRSLYTLLGLVGVVVLAGLIFVIYRSITTPLESLLDRASSVANEELPALVMSLRNSDNVDELPVVQPIPVSSNDEIGELVGAFNDVQSTAYDLATEQALGRRAVAQMFVNLGRRNQQLLQRILAQLTELENKEEDPDTLAELFELDNVVTRMRRNAESLLVLAGAQTPRQWSKPVKMENTIRAAFGEVEGYERIEIAALAEVDVQGNVVSDVAHLMAELLENALKFSDTKQNVLVNGQIEKDGYLVTIFDQGIGMTAEELAENNSRITDPPPLDKVPTQFLGLYVVGRLADRHGIRVRLIEAPGRGVMARIELPKNILALEAAEGESTGDELGTMNFELETKSSEITLTDHEISTALDSGPDLDSETAVAEESALSIEDELAELDPPTMPEVPAALAGKADTSPLEEKHDFDAELAQLEDQGGAPESGLTELPSRTPRSEPLGDLPVRGGGASTPAVPTAPTLPTAATTEPTAAITEPTAVAEPMVTGDVESNGIDGLPARQRGQALTEAAPIINAGPAPVENREATDGSEAAAGAFSSMMSALSSGINRGIQDSSNEDPSNDTNLTDTNSGENRGSDQ